MKFHSMMSTMLASFLLLAGLTSGPALADDGEINNKSMSQNINVPVFDQGIVNSQLSEAEHVFTDWMKFYVPAQTASGAPPSDGSAEGLIVYNDIDLNLVEELPVAKPLINVFIYGPQFEVPDTAFAHRWFDTYAAVSLDDGVTFKKTNLSESAVESSFNLDTDHNPSGGDPLPGDHNIRLGNAFHAPGYDTPYTAHCSECHGQGLQGVAEVPSCYSCHDNKWEEPTPVDLGPIIYMAELEGQDKKKSKLKLEGENAADSAEVTILNAITGHAVGTTEAEDDGKFKFTEKFEDELPPCVVMAEYTDDTGEVLTGPSLAVVDKKTGEPIENCEGSPVDLTEYPGGTYNVFHATAGNQTLVAWPSRYCQKGQPAYTEYDVDTGELTERGSAIVDFIQSDNPDLGITGLPDFGIVNDLYLVDAFGVAGSQGSSDFADEGYPQAGVVPFGCVWAARGILLPGDDPRTDTITEESYMVWTKAERLTSGRRDPNRIEVSAVQDAGFVITWQEDPEGLRPGQGLGPGEGWSGAVAHSQTDVWYSFINSEYFGIVEDPDDTTKPVDILEHDLTVTGRPQVFVPMAVPMRMTNNAKCNPPVGELPTTDDLYCDGGLAAPYGIKNQCADTVTISTGSPSNPSETEICVVDTDGDGDADLPNRANTASTRPRLGLQGYDQTVDDKSAWVIFAAEESKGLGKFFFTPDGLDGGGFDGLADPCEEGSSEDCTEEIGKNQWYHSFDMGTPDTSAGIGVTDSLVESLVFQGNMLNQSEVYWETGEFYGLMDTSELGEDGGSLYGDYDFQIANTEIARRASLLAQGLGKATASANGLMATPSWKQGVMRQGGPADTMLRRIVLPEVFDATVDNPYAFANMVCEDWVVFKDGDGTVVTNPYYPGGLCADPATNLSGVVPDTCLDSDTGGGIDCPTVTFDGTNCAVSGGGTLGCGDTQPILQGLVQGEGNTMKVLTWHQCPSDGVAQAGADIVPVTCDTDDRTDAFVNLADQSWYNPLDVSKGHRGFIDGDFVMFLYAWSPNWRLNAKGSDRYELYVRRSFDGGNTWTTTPTSFTASDGNSYPGDGTVTCESYRATETGTGDVDEPKVCYDFAQAEVGAAEHARNVTQHKSMRITTLDPRYAISGSPRGVSIDPLTCLDGLPPADADGVASDWSCDDTSAVQDTDLRNPSRYFMVFETGDNSTVDVGEAEPLDLFYGRGESFGDDYTVWYETDTGFTLPDEGCYPSDPHDVLDISDVITESGFCNEFDNLNTGGDTHSSEASLGGNPDASKMYGVWAEWVFDEHEEVEKSDAQARRVWWLDDYISTENSWTLPGTQ